MSTPAASAQPLRRRLQNPYSKLPDWFYPANVVVWYTLFVIYGLVVSLIDTKPAHYLSYLSPFNSPEFLVNIGPLHIPPALWIGPIPLAFRLSCYYYRKAYYRGYLLHPRSCARAEPARGTYRGETRFWIWNNFHRFAMYVTVAQIIVLWYDTFHTFVVTPSGGFWNWAGTFHFGLGNVIIIVDVICLSAYTFGCHAFRHWVGGGKDCQSCIGARHKAWKGSTFLNVNHGTWAWVSMFTVWGTDIYIRLLSHGWLIPHGIWN
ncbi:MAG: hypothetical protein ACREQM_17610 [Candidatus Dormibacteraceae bacterium]